MDIIKKKSRMSKRGLIILSLLLFVIFSSLFLINNSNNEIHIIDAATNLLPAVNNETIELDLTTKKTVQIDTSKLGSNITYKSLDTNIATVDKNGNVEGYQIGTTQINVTDDSGTNKLINVNVSKTLTATFIKQGIGVTSISTTTATCVLNSINRTSCTVEKPKINVANGYVAIGWNTDANDTSDLSSLTLINDMTFYSISYKKALKHFIKYEKYGDSVLTISKTKDSCTIPASYNNTKQSKSCSVIAPNIETDNTTDTILGWSPTKDAFNVVRPGSIINLSNDSIYYTMISSSGSTINDKEKPKWQLKSVTSDSTTEFIGSNNKLIITIDGTDNDEIGSSKLTADDINIKGNHYSFSVSTKELSAAKDIKKGYEYTLTVSGWNTSDTLSLIIAENTLYDKQNNSNIETTIPLNVSVNYTYTGKNLADIFNDKYLINGSVSTYYSKEEIIEGDNPNNYVWYSGKLWRAVALNLDQTVKLLSVDSLASIPFNYPSSTASVSLFSGSYIERWLNNTQYDGFLGTLYNYNNYINTASKWDDTDYSGSIYNTPTQSRLITDPVGLIHPYEVYLSDYYLNNDTYWYTITPVNTSNPSVISYYKDNRGRLTNSSIPLWVNTNSYNVRPAINLKTSVELAGGNGILTNPYRLVGDESAKAKDLLNTRHSGEYVYFNNQKYRIVDIEKNNSTKIVSDSILKSGSSVLYKAFNTIKKTNGVLYSPNDTTSLAYYLNTDWYNSLTTADQNMLVTGTWYIGDLSSSSTNTVSDYDLTTCTTPGKDCTRDKSTITAKVGLLRYGELFTGGTTSEKYWLLTPYKYGGYNNYYVLTNENGETSFNSTENTITSTNAIKPSVFLNSNVYILGGTGTNSDPYIITQKATSLKTLTATLINADSNVKSIGSNSISCNTTNTESSCKVTLPSITNKIDGYTSYWSTDNSGETGLNPNDEVILTNNTNYYAKAKDTTSPYWSISGFTTSTGDNLITSEDAATITINGIDKSGSVDSNLTIDDISILVNGSSITSSQKALSQAKAITNGYSYDLTISNIKASGIISLVIKAGTLEDKSGNANISNSLTSSIGVGTRTYADFEIADSKVTGIGSTRLSCIYTNASTGCSISLPTITTIAGFTGRWSLDKTTLNNYPESNVTIKKETTYYAMATDVTKPNITMKSVDTSNSNTLILSNTTVKITFDITDASGFKQNNINVDSFQVNSQYSSYTITVGTKTLSAPITIDNGLEYILTLSDFSGTSNKFKISLNSNLVTDNYNNSNYSETFYPNVTIGKEFTTNFINNDSNIKSIESTSKSCIYTDATKGCTITTPKIEPKDGYTAKWYAADDFAVAPNITMTNDSTKPWKEENDFLYLYLNYDTSNLTYTFDLTKDSILSFDWSVYSLSSYYGYLYYTLTKNGTVINNTGSNTAIYGSDYVKDSNNHIYITKNINLTAGHYVLKFTLYASRGASGYIKNVEVGTIPAGKSTTITSNSSYYAKALDTIKPTINLSKIKTNSDNSKIVAKEQTTLTFDIIDSGSGLNGTITADNIVVLLNGQAVTPTTKILSPATNITNGKEYTLTLGGFTADGLLSIQVNANSIADNVNNANDTTILSPNVAYYKESSSISFASDTSNANSPELVSGMIPVVYDQAVLSWVKADSKQTSWYNYDKQIWANAVTIKNPTTRSKYMTAKVGTPINMADINAMFVWIPRYSYTIGNTYGVQGYGGSTPSQATPGAIDIKFVPTSTTDTGTATYTGSTASNYYTSPAFCWGDTCDTSRTDSSNTEKAGIWIGKFKNSAVSTDNCKDGSCTDKDISIKPNEISWSTSLANIYKNINDSMNGINAIVNYGFSGTTYNSHFLKNTEWGAIAYLSQSKYGKYGNTTYSGEDKKVGINNCTTGANGVAGDKISDSSFSDTTCSTNTYQTTIGQTASTTGNIYGIYDMNSIYGESIFNRYLNRRKTYAYVGYTKSFMSGFSGIIQNYSSSSDSKYKYVVVQGIDMPSAKYYNTYYQVVTKDSNTTNRILGDALFEMSIVKKANGYEYTTWYNSDAKEIDITSPFYKRGFNGIFAFTDSYSGGTSRVAIVP